MLKELQDYYETKRGEEEVHRLISLPDTNYSFHHDLLYHAQRLYVPSIEHIRSAILHEFHASPTASHSGIKATMARLATSFFWPGMYHDTKRYIKECLPCQQNKSLHQKPFGLLQPIPIPTKLSKELTTDFITHLPSSLGHMVI